MNLPTASIRGRRPDRRRLLPIVLVAVLLLDLGRLLATGALATTTFGVFLWDGIVLGLVIGLAGVGLSMTYSILGFANVAHGEYLTAGAFGGWAGAYLLAGAGQFAVDGLLLLGLGDAAITAQAVGVSITRTPLVVVAGLLVAAATTTAIALVIDRYVYRPMRDQDGISLLIASIGVAFILRYVVAFVFQTGTFGVTSGTNVPNYGIPGTLVTVSAHEATLVVGAVGLMVGLHLFLRRSKLGIAMRATADNEQLAQISGIPLERVVRLTWLIGGSLTGMAGFLLVLERGTVSFNFGWLLLLLIFAAVILGGIGSIYGAILGGLTIGVVSRLSLVWLPPSFMNVTAFAVMIVVLVVRPRGLFRGRSSV